MIGATRRELMRLIGFAPVIGQSAMRELAGAVNGSLAATVAAAAVPMMNTPPGMAILGKALFGNIDQLTKQAEAEFYRERRIDPDIAAFRSTSAVFKARKQIERDREVMGALAMARQMMWGQS